jgi:hypothetical protein
MPTTNKHLDPKQTGQEAAKLHDDLHKRIVDTWAIARRIPC